MKKFIPVIALLLAFSFQSNSQTSSMSELVKINWPKQDNWHIADQKKVTHKQ